MDSDRTLLGVLRDAGLTADVAVPDFPLPAAPFVLIDPLPGTRRRGAFENGAWSLSSYARDRAEARALWLSAADAIEDAWVGPEPRLNTATVTALPAPVPSGIEGLHRYEGEVRASVRAAPRFT